MTKRRLLRQKFMRGKFVLLLLTTLLGTFYRFDIIKNMKKILLFGLTAVFVFSAGSVLARTQPNPKVSDLVNKQRMKLEEQKTRLQEGKKQFKQNIEEKGQKLKEEISQKRATLKEKLAVIKDERKKKSVEKIDQQINELNKRVVNQLSAVLDKLSDMLERVANRAGVAESKGYDVSMALSAIESANQAISFARTAIQAQAGKTYTIQITTEENIKRNVGDARQALNADLKTIRVVVKAAHDAVRKAAVALGQLRKQGRMSPTVSPLPSVTITTSPEANQ